VTGFTSPPLRLRQRDLLAVVGHCYDGLPDEACGLFAGRVDGAGITDGVVETVYLCTNAQASAKTYTVEPHELLRAMRDAEDRGLEITGVFHSHTHTDAYPSPTDVAQAPDPGWLYAIVSLKDGAPVLRAYRIVDGKIREVPVVLTA
jgi:proteasome lid subunit RPN8/RPN11